MEFRKKHNSKQDFSALDSLEGKSISIAGTVQYLDILPELKKYLENLGKKVLMKKGAFYDGHIIGCNPAALDLKADTLLILADGKFHAINNALRINREVYVFNLTNLEKITRQDLDKELGKIKGKKVKFLSVNRLGLIVSTKYGQNFRGIKSLTDRLYSAKKEVFVFETDNIPIGDLENFPDIPLWINTACYGLALDDPRIVNLQDILELI